MIDEIAIPEDDPLVAEFPMLGERMVRYAYAVTSGISQNDAYRMVYKADKMGSWAISNETTRLNNHPALSRLIYKLKCRNAKKAEIDRDYIVRWWWMRATYNSKELSTLVTGACHYCHGEGHLFQWRMPDFMEATKRAEQNDGPLPDIAGGFGYDARRPPHPDCPKCDGRGLRVPWFGDPGELSEAAATAFDGVKTTQHGTEVLMADKHKAMEMVCKLTGLDVVQVRLLADLPNPEEVAAMDPHTAAALYKRVMQGGAA